MKSVLSAIMRNPKGMAAVIMVMAAILVPLGLKAWGNANRVTFTAEKPASYVTFNSITNTQGYGDERNFVRIREMGANFGEEVNLASGKEYEVKVFYHNNAAANLGLVATNATMRVQMPSTVKSGEKARITGFVSAANAKHLDANGNNLGNQVWDEVYLNAKNGDFALRYVPNSAVITNRGALNGQHVAETLYTTGAKLGYDKFDGNLPGCNEYAGYVTFRVKAVQPNFEITKQVSLAGAKQYGKKLAVNAGDKVEYKIHYKNTGSMQQDNVIIKDKLPAGLSIVPGTTYASFGGKWTAVKNDDVVRRGINVGSYAPNGGVYVKFTAHVATNDSLATCGLNTIVNTATAETENGSKSDTATVMVTKKCQDAPVKACDLTANKVVMIDNNKLSDSRYTQDLAKCTAKVCDLTTKKVVTVSTSQLDNKRYTKNISKCTITTTPKELPRTGISNGLIAMFSASALAAAAVYAVNSRVRN